MQEWFLAGYFTMDLMVQRVCDSAMLPLGKLPVLLLKQRNLIQQASQPYLKGCHSGGYEHVIDRVLVLWSVLRFVLVGRNDLCFSCF